MAEDEMPLLERLDNRLEQALFYIAAILLILVSITVFYAVTLRYVFNEPPLWAEEAPRVFFLWMTYIGIAVATSISAWVNVLLLVRGLRGFWRPQASLIAKICRMLTASLSMGIALWLLQWLLDSWLQGPFYLKATGLGLLVAGGAAIYFAAALAFRATSVRELKSGFGR